MHEEPAWTEGFPSEPGFYWFCVAYRRQGYCNRVSYGISRRIGGGGLIHYADGEMLFPADLAHDSIEFYHKPAPAPPAPVP